MWCRGHVLDHCATSPLPRGGGPATHRDRSPRPPPAAHAACCSISYSWPSLLFREPYCRQMRAKPPGLREPPGSPASGNTREGRADRSLHIWGKPPNGFWFLRLTLCEVQGESETKEHRRPTPEVLGPSSAPRGRLLTG